jgi:hypothetical protein
MGTQWNNGGYTGHAWQGEQYKPGRDVAEIAKLIRTGIKEKIKAGILPKGKYSVKIDRFSGGSSIDIRIKEFQGKIFNPEFLELEARGQEIGRNGMRYSKELSEALKVLESMLNTFRMDDSDGMIDYFHTNFYGHASVDWQLEAAERDSLKSYLDSLKGGDK